MASLSGAVVALHCDCGRGVYADLYFVAWPDSIAIAEAIRDDAVCVGNSGDFRGMVSRQLDFPLTPATPEAFERECAIRRPPR